MDLRPEGVKGSGAGGPDISLVACQQEKVRGGKGGVVVWSLVVGNGQDGVACLPVCLHQLFRGKSAIRKGGVGMQIGTVLLCLGGNDENIVCSFPVSKKGSRRGLPFLRFLPDILLHGGLGIAGHHVLLEDGNRMTTGMMASTAPAMIS